MRTVFVFFCLFLLFKYSFSQIEYSEKDDTVFFGKDFFELSEPFEITVETNITKLRQTKFQMKYLPADIIYNNLDGEKVRKPVKIKTRGIARLKICHNPPLWINFKKSGIKCNNIESKKVKVVTHCKSGRIFDEYLLKEFLAYKIYNIITDYSFKVRLIRINVVDSNKSKKMYSGWGFIIEPEKLMAKRLSSFAYKRDNLSMIHADPIQVDIMSFFQYLIGNTDFEINKRHNIKILKPDDYTKQFILPIPYDFDYAGIVNANYALPMEELSISSVVDRYYVGMCRDEANYDKVIELYKQKENKIMSLINNFEYLDRGIKDNMIDYINDFYYEIEDSKIIKKRIKSTCRTPN